MLLSIGLLVVGACLARWHARHPSPVILCLMLGSFLGGLVPPYWMVMRVVDNALAPGGAGVQWAVQVAGVTAVWGLLVAAAGIISAWQEGRRRLESDTGERLPAGRTASRAPQAWSRIARNRLRKAA